MSEQLLPIPWSRLRWITTIGVVMVLQVLLIYLFSGEEVPSRKAKGKKVRYALVSGKDHQPTNEMSLVAIRDPSLLGLPNPEGASGSAWLNSKPLKHELYEWSAEPAWLKPSPERLGTTFDELMESYEPARYSMAKKEKPEFRDTFPTRSVLAQQSRLLIKGELADRSLVTSRELPLIANETLVSNSVVRAAVDAQGRPLSTLLIDSSGSSEADRKAVEHAKRARFKPLSDAGSSNGSEAGKDALTWGRLEYQWRTVAPEPNDETGEASSVTSSQAL